MAGVLRDLRIPSVEPRALGAQGIAARFVPNAWWLQVLLAIGTVVVFGLLVHVAYNAFRRRQRARHPETTRQQRSRLERGGAAILGAVVCAAALSVYFTDYHTNTRPLGTPETIGGLPANSYYLSLGDSYAAGEGLAPFVAGISCHRSISGAFEHRLTFDTNVTHIRNACSGATIADVANGVAPPGLPRATPTQPIQLSRIPTRGDISLATIFIAGNDAEWPAVLQFCAVHVSCNTTPYISGKTRWPTLDAWATNRLSEISQSLDKLYQQVRSDVSGRVIVLGYPPLFGSGHSFSGMCDALWAVFDTGERRWFARTEQQLDADINKAATAAHVEYVATDASFTGHEPCRGSASWVNALVAGNPSAILRGNLGKIVGNGSFHPNSYGQLAFARTVSCYLHEHKNPPPTSDGMSTAGSASDTDLVSCVRSTVNKEIKSTTSTAPQ